MAILKHGADIRLGGKTYKLARKESLISVGFPITTRVWSVTPTALATQITPRPDVRKGEIDGEYVIIANDWSKGVTGDHENLPDCHFFNDNVAPIYPGSLRSVAPVSVITEAGNSFGGDPACWIEFNNTTFLIAGQFCFKFQTAAGFVVDKDFGSGKLATDAIVYDNNLLVCFGSGQVIWKRNTSGTWDETGTAYADYFALVEDVLWKSYNTNEISSLAMASPPDDPQDNTKWATAQPIGDDDVAITDLNAQGERLVVSKEDGLYLGDSGYIFPNVLPQIVYARKSTNGKDTKVIGADIYYPYRDGLLRRDSSGAVEEISLQQYITSAAVETDTPPGLRVAALAVQGPYLWMVTEPSYFPRAACYCKKTTNDGAAYTTYTTQVTDRDIATVADISALDTVANGDWLLIGGAAQFYAFLCQMESVNINAVSTILQYWNGSTWTSLGTTIGQPIVDHTKLSAVTFGQSGSLGVNTLPADWAMTTIDGVNAYWMRVSLSGALSATVTISEIRLFAPALATTPLSYVFRGRPREIGDVRNKSIIWDSIYALPVTISMPPPTAMMVSGYWPNRRGCALLLANQNHAVNISLPYTPLEYVMDSQAGNSYSARHDMGAPNILKQFLDITIKGRTIDADHTVDLYYRVNESTTWVSLASNIATSPSRNALTNITGYSIQWRLGFDAVANDKPTEVNEVECRLRLLPTTKNVYKAYLLLADQQVASSRGTLPAASLQLASLQSALNTRAALIDPLGASVNVTVQSLQVEEALQDDRGYPALLVSLGMAEE